MGIGSRHDRLERTAGVRGAACDLCAAWAARAEAEQFEFGPEWKRGAAYPSQFNCPNCGKPFEVVFQVIERVDAEGVSP